MLYGLITLGRMTDQYVPTRPAEESSRYCGMDSVMPGTSTPASSEPRISFWPRNRYFAIAYPQAAEMTTVSSAPPPA